MAVENRLFPHLLPKDIEVWKRWQARYGQDYNQFLYDLRCGTGRDPGETYPDNIRQMAIGLSQRRIDAIGRQQAGVTLFEITTNAGLTAIGQLTAYPILYRECFPDETIIATALVAESIQTDIQSTLAAMPVTVYLV